MQAKLSPRSMAIIKRGGLAILPNLKVARVEVYNLTLPFISPGVVNLTVLIARPLYGDDYVAICYCLRQAPPLLPNVTSLRIDGDDHLEFFHRPLCRFCLGMQRLRTVVLAPSALGSRLLEALSRLPSLVSIRVSECARARNGGYFYEPGAQVGFPLPNFVEGSFRSLREMAFTSTSPYAAVELIRSANFPCGNLESLWIRWPKGSSFIPEDIREFLATMSSLCVSLRRMTLRFSVCGDYFFDREGRVSRLEYRHIESFLDFPSLRYFAIDHTWPLFLKDSDLAILSVRASEFIELWLNPYPVLTSINSRRVPDDLPHINCLRYFAEHCHFLSRLGILFDGRNPGVEIPRSVPFTSLTELFVGCSLIAVLEIYDEEIVEEWRAISVFIYHILPRSATLSSLYLRSDEEVGRLVCSEMRSMGGMEATEMDAFAALTHAWRSVLGMVWFIRQNIRELVL